MILQIKDLKPKITKKTTFFILLALLIAGGSFYFFTKPVSAAWFDENWLYRKAVSITNGGVLGTSYQVSFTLDTATLITAGKLQSDCDDLRVTDGSGNLIPYWVETGESDGGTGGGCNATDSKIWTKIPSTFTSGSTAYVYYGNPSVSNAENGSKVFEFFDNFNNLDTTNKWTTSGSPSVSSGELTLSNSAKMVTKSLLSNTDGTRTLGFRAKTPVSVPSASYLGFSNTNTLTSNTYADDSATVMLASEENYTTYIGSSNLVSYHKLEETTSTEANQFKASGYYDTGKFSQALSMYGKADGTTASTFTFPRGTQISGNNYFNINTNQGTISFWVSSPTAIGSITQDQYFFDFGDATNARIALYMDASEDDLTLNINGTEVSSTGITFNASTWYHVVVDYNFASDSYNVYVNNTSVITSSTAFTAPTPASVNFIGSTYSGTYSANSLFDDFAVFDRVLDSTERSSLYNSGTGATADTIDGPSLKFYANMDGSGSLAPVTYNLAASASKVTGKSTEFTGGANVIADGNMEAAGTASWPPFDANPDATISKETSPLFTDTQSLKVLSNTDPSANNRADQTVTISANSNYYFSVWYNGSGNSNTAIVRLRDGASATYCKTGGNAYFLDSSASTWKRHECSFKSGANTSLLVSLWTSGANPKYVMFDNVVLVSQLVNDGSMEGTLTNSWTQETNATMAGDTSEHTGIQEMKITAGAANVGASQSVTLTNTTYYLVSGWARATSGDTAQIIVDKGDGTTATIGSVTATSYTRVSGVFKSTGTAGNIYLRAAANGDIVWFDDVSIIALDNIPVTFKPWTPVDDVTSAGNDLSVHGDSDGVSSSASQTGYGNAYTFDGSTGYLRQKIYDVAVGALSYADTNTDISDTGQEFEDWDNDDGGSAEYMVVVTNSDNTTSWGYFCADDGGTQTAVYTLKACTGGSEGFNGTSPSGKTPVGYEIRKTDFQISGTSLTIGAWVKATSFNGRSMLAKRYSDSSTKNSFELQVGGTNQFYISFSNDGSTQTIAQSSTGYSTATWYFIVGVLNGSTATLYINGSSGGTQTGVSSISDSAGTFEIGRGASTTSFFTGSIDSPFVLNTALTANQIKALYNTTKYNFATTNEGANGFASADSSVTADTSYHKFEVSQQSSAASFKADSTDATTATTNYSNENSYVRLENADATNTVVLDYVYVRQSYATEPSSSVSSTEEQSPGPVGYWKFDDGQGTAAQDSGSSNNDGTISGATWITEDQCVSGKCLSFDGSDDVVTVTQASSVNLTGKTAYTVSAWFKAVSDGENDVGQIIQKGTNTYLRVSGQSGTSLNIDASLDLATTDATKSLTAPVTTNTWNHIALVYTDDSDDEITIYVNGKDMGSSTNGDGSPATDSNNLLAGGTTTANFQGYIDEVKVYPYARTGAQIKTDYLAGAKNASARSGTSAILGSKPQQFMSEGLVGYWKMDEASGNASDSSGNSLTLTNNSSMAYAAGKFGNSVQGDGVADYLNTTTAINGIKTVSFWAYTPDTTNYFLNLVNSSAYITSSSGTFSVTGFTSPSIYVNGVLNGTISANTWTHIVITTNTGINANAFAVGLTNDGSNHFYTNTSKIDEVRIYNRTLSPKEVSDLYNFAPGPVGYWKMDEKSGTTISDSSGNGKTSSAFTNNVAWTTGKYGAGLLFDGTDDAVQFTEASQFDLGATTDLYTVEGWFKTTTDYSGNATVVGKDDGSGAYPYELYLNSSEYACFQISDGTNAPSACGSTALNDGKWHHIGGVRDVVNDKVYLYVDGAQITSTTDSTTATAANNDNLSIGNAGTSYTNQDFNGSIDDVKIYNYARTQKQIVEDMNAGHPAVGSPIGSAVGYWKFDEGQGTTANNSGSAGSALNATLSCTSGCIPPVFSDAGKFNKALQLDNTNDIITINDNTALKPSGAITFSAWFNADETSNNTKIISKTESGSYAITLNNGGDCSTSTLCFIIKIASAYKAAYIPISGNISTGTWYHVAGTYDGSNVRLYLNGVLRATTAATGTISHSTAPLCFGLEAGASSCSGNRFSGYIDEFKLYDYALTADEVKTEYNRGSSLVLGSLGSNSSYPSNSSSQEYCVPGDSTSCAAPKARWDFEEKTGTSAYDTSGTYNSDSTYNTGTITAGAGGFTTGKYGGGYNFDNADTAVSAGSGSTLDNLPSAGMTLEAWIYPKGLGENSAGFILAKNSGTTPSSGWILQMGASYALTFTVDGSTDLVRTTSSAVTQNAWNHVAVSWDGVITTASSARIYINGKEASYATTTNGASRLSDAASTFYIGNDSTSAATFNGIIDNVRVFNYARSAAQAAYDYNRGAPIGHWKMDECQGTTINDSSGNSNNGTLTIGASGEDTVGTCTTASTAWGGSGGTGAGKRNYAPTFDGTDDYISITDTANLRFDASTADFSLFAWVKRTTTGTEYIISKEDADNDGYRLIFTSSNTVQCSEDSTDVTSTSTITDTSWHLVGCIIDRDGNGQVYIDGRADGSTVSMGTDAMATASNITIGTRSYTSTSYLNGQIDDVRIYNYALTATQVKDVMNNGAVRFGPLTGSP